ncbi:MAG: hypothetical protein A2900_00450 [Candidatus Chisholmbacteria bacterium RIFCSPLOWO2_01_FULL_50_28]|uniref:Fido domain-containing protein n=1 Tax=Candidatus Chisholmbacteria bacterium RIFCSPHIGHO2_01_FULL_52_32 TaxID=1797591 RepID=A0A1G1VR35_9BACT|nr:MAG: hypothetical protein A2786_00795 [Candidatus Chisholmbacteria bacterium RIFCSPHIGHO2_01_FULL_52_32]OGY20598.1 MAG: hypothetical protein A2900_00450 [Candidatus Chisholmbacteria bacterium RIFCSPLOWO2_01_FULL_50_28]
MILDQSIFQRIVEKKKRLDSLRPLPTSLVNRLREQVIIEWTYNSNAIEGTSLSLRETELIIEHGLTIKGKPLKEHFEAINHKGAILFLEKLVEKGGFRIDQLLIRQIHQLILKEIDNDHAGRYREVEVKITGSGFVPPSPARLPIAMRQLEKWLAKSENQQHLIDYSALAHFKLVDIHPFIDGNGRTARLLMNLILMNRGYPPTVILKTDRQKYYRALDLAHRGELKLFVDFIGRSVERSLTWYLEAVIPEKKKKMVEMWQLLSELALKAPYSQEYLSLLARRGRIEAVKKGRNWYSNLQAVRHYIEASGRKR